MTLEEVNMPVLAAMIVLCFIIAALRQVFLGHDVDTPQEDVPQEHEMTQADKDARTKMYKELRERPDEPVEDVSDKMSMRLQGTARKMNFVQVRPGPAINLLFDCESGIPELFRIETDDGFPIGSGEWSKRDYGAKVLRITDLPVPPVPETLAINLILDGPPGMPGPGRLISVETDDGTPVGSGSWAPRPDGKWSMRITELPVVESKKPWGMEYLPHLSYVIKKDDDK